MRRAVIELEKRFLAPASRRPRCVPRWVCHSPPFSTGALALAGPAKMAPSLTASNTQQMDDFIVRLEKQIWATWLPVVASAALALGFVLGSWFANARQAPCETTNAGPPQEAPTIVAPGEHKTKH